MKIRSRSVLLLCFACSALMLTNCGSDSGDDKSQEQIQLEKLVGNWNLSTVTLDGSSRTDFVNVVMSISGNYTSTGGTYSYSFTGTRPNPSPWPANGTWQFDANPASQLVRLNDGQKINYALSNGDAQLTMEFNYQGGGFAGGRTEQVAGNWVFTFSK